MNELQDREVAEVDNRLLRVYHPLVFAHQLCVNCEDITGKRAVRLVTPNGTCETCGSGSMVAIRQQEWKWHGGGR